MKTLAIDVDECCLKMWPLWLQYCNDRFLKSVSEEDARYNYNLCELFGEQAIDFWGKNDLYTDRVPSENCLEVLTNLVNNGWEIGFVTYCKKGHFESKCDWINKWFPFRSFINVTKEKNGTRCTHFMDDRNKYLNQQPDGVTLIKMQTPLSQEEQLMKSHFIVDDWFEFEELWMKGGLDEKRN